MDQCAHQPGEVVDVDPGEEVASTCTRCGAGIVRTYDYVGDEDRIAGWGRWKRPPRQRRLTHSPTGVMVVR